MKPVALDHARGALDGMQQAVAGLRSARSHEQAAPHWLTFVQGMQRLVNKLLAGSKGCPTSARWSEGISRERKNDRLLIYIHQARHADEHGLAEQTVEAPAAAIIVDENETMTVNGHTFGVMHFWRSTYLVPITNRGVTYYPPQSRMPATVEQDPRRAANAAQAALLIAERWMAEAEALPRH